MEDTNLVNLFHGWAIEDKPPVVQLLNKDFIPVAGLYLDKLNFDTITISTTNTSEKYYIYFGGIAIFFTYYRKVENNL